MAVAARGGYGFPWRQAGASRRGAAGALALLALLLGQGFAWQGASRWRWPIGPLPGAMTRTAGQPAYLAAAGLGRRADGVGRAAGPGGVALASLAHRPVAGGHRAGRERQLAASAHAADRGAGHFLPAFAAAVLGPGAARRGLVPGALRVLPRGGRGRTRRARGKPAALAQRAGSGPVRQPAGGRAALARGAWRRRAAGRPGHAGLWRGAERRRHLARAGLSAAAGLWPERRGMPAVPAPAWRCRAGTVERPG